MTSTVRCAIYTRKSSEEGLDQAFNSLDAQREACAAYILSQRHEGWTACPELYDDGGFSGGNMQRPGLVRLMADVAAKRVDVIVVYKVDRLTRSLADFARIVDVLDGAGASFVSVTQSFNTTTSMGRLTLNVLLSFAQFEREVTGERIRDKIAASKQKGLWMGGPVPLGYDVRERQLVVNESEAETVRHIMQRYVELGSVPALADVLEAEGVVTKVKHLRDGGSAGGVPFRRGGLFHLLGNCLYVGEVGHKGQRYAGAHAPIVERALWDRVQAMLAGKAPARQRRENVRCPSLLAALLHDGHGRAMTPSHTVRRSRRYRYYMTQLVAPGDPARWRVPAHELEQLVVARLCRHLARSHDEAPTLGQRDEQQHDAGTMVDRLLGAPDHERAREIAGLVARIDLHRDRVALRLHDDAVLEAAATLIRSGKRTRLVAPEHVGAGRPDEPLVRLIATAHAARRALDEAGERSVDEVAAGHGLTPQYFAQLARLGGLAPDIVTAILHGRQPAGLTRTRLARTKALPLDWQAQRDMLGIA